MTVDLAAAREHFLSLVAAIRPDLHRYAARLVGSAIDGEDVVQDALAKAFYALSLAHEPPPLRPWLFRITRNAAIDHLRRYERTHAESFEEERMADDLPPADPAVTRAALSAFTALPVAQRSAVILKDVLGESLEDIAAHLETTVGAVKSLLVRGRRGLAAAEGASGSHRAHTDRKLLERYVALFNARDWAGVQALLLEECRLDLVSKAERRGQAIGGYFGRYARDTDLTFCTGAAEGRDAIGVFRGGALAYVILLEERAGRVSLIRDYRYVPYLAAELDFTAG